MTATTVADLRDTAATPPRQADRLYHDLLSSDETLAVRAESRAVAERLTDQARRIAQSDESADSFPWDAFHELGRAGTFGLPFGSEVGGRGLQRPVSATAVALEELAYVSNSLAAVVDVHCILAGHALEFGTTAIRDRYLRRVVAGEIVGSFATTEPAASSDLSALTTTAHRDGPEWVITGHKRFISNSPVAAFVTVLCRTGEASSMFVVDLTVHHLSTRQAFGRRLADFQHWQFRMAQRATELEAARTLYLKAALRLDGGTPLPEPEAAMAKAYATRLGVELADDAMQIFGGYGYLRELGADGTAVKVEELYRDAKIGGIYEGTNEIQKWIIARSVFGRDIGG